MRSRFLSAVLAGSVTASLFVLPSAGAQATAALELRPHCESEEQESVFGGPVPDIEGTMTPTDGGRCGRFLVQSPEEQYTPTLSPGDLLDMDLVVRNPGTLPISRVRAWLSYDPTILSGESLTFDSNFDQPSPEESDFVPEDGYIKIDVAASSSVRSTTVVVARIQVRIAEDASQNTALAFLVDGTTSVTVGTGDGAGVEGLSAPPSWLNIIIKNAQAEQPPASEAGADTAEESSAPVEESSSSAIATGGQTASAPSETVSSSSASDMAAATTPSDAPQAPVGGLFGSLQVQNLRVTTLGGSIFAAWDQLPSSEIAGYYVYYSRVSGRYIQRKSVPGDQQSVVIRALPENQTYYVAIRGVNVRGQETDFGPEVAVTVGKPLTSTSPLSASAIAPPRPATGDGVAGDAGLPAVWLVFLVACAVIGTAIAFRRQLVALPARP
ncbi:MAG: hypothetical protein G01um101425_931 [Candidatus Peregrinibacteria bacterium Gr01-1014_25]|nr:MAG: hypothetical protein G01um101425_931 [Candidatus Peregrinibacteria bacterium Gr01-1014_25]